MSSVVVPLERKDKNKKRKKTRGDVYIDKTTQDKARQRKTRLEKTRGLGEGGAGKGRVGGHL